MRCCGRWNTKFHRRCEKHSNVGRLESGAEGSAEDSTGTPTLVSISRLFPVLLVTRDERAEGGYGSATLTQVKQNLTIVRRNMRQAAGLTRQSARGRKLAALLRWGRTAGWQPRSRNWRRGGKLPG